jgi:hypothetical protein
MISQNRGASQGYCCPQSAAIVLLSMDFRIGLMQVLEITFWLRFFFGLWWLSHSIPTKRLYISKNTYFKAYISKNDYNAPNPAALLPIHAKM